ncbi:hypothetical protein LZ496_04165 [Sphingomonas sp. NSE70-1]|uniref:5-bromo-4-chloroindolyl phosphate hydrolysis protein n=1 Tax=Sphingomonas caseinilyticus TaxID=2908205 RepID=A0ABT0RTE2_9SPHN|nr:hypothetical protein [Sphingomonas caseinilyticus]MCL6697980.1 hypothetical protein [Sphingomonas caseinilyticus]
MIPDKTSKAIDHANAIFARLDERDGAVRDAARRERDRLNAGLGQAVLRAGIAVGVISLATIGIGLIVPIGMFGFLAAVGLAIGVAAVLLFSSGREIAAPNVTPDLPNAQMVQRFDSYLFRARRALPAPAQAELDQLSAQLPSLRQTLERIPDLDPNAQDARRLMSVHLPNLIDRYLHVPSNYRGQLDGEGISVDERLVEALSAGRVALKDISEKLARNDMAAFETQGRFIQSRYSEKTLDD